MEKVLDRLVERHIIKKNSNKELYLLVDSMCYASKNIYNYATYIMRQCYNITNKLYLGEILNSKEKYFLKWINTELVNYNKSKLENAKKKNKVYTKLNSFDSNHKYIDYNFLEYLIHKSDCYKTNKDILGLSQVVQQILRGIINDWKSYKEALNEYRINKFKFKARPKKPNYKDKNKGRHYIILTNQNCKLKDNTIVFPLIFKGFTLKTKVSNLQQVRIKIYSERIVIDIIYKVTCKPKKNIDISNKKCLGLDLGINNLITIGNNIGLKPILVDGRYLKSINRFYNKKRSYYQSILKSFNNKDDSKRLQRITNKRNNIVNDILHKVSRYVINYALENNIDTIIIGYNEGWKQESNLSKKTNQNFIGIPFLKLINMIEYKGTLEGINIVKITEEYTSGTSFLDNEKSIKENYNKKRRVYRGLFKSNKGVLINADVNASNQIIRKQYPNISYIVNDNILKPRKIYINKKKVR